jgi:hypothetical protein
VTLPTKPERGEVDWTKKKTLLYGPPKVGKSTLIAELDPGLRVRQGLGRHRRRVPPQGRRHHAHGHGRRLHQP